MTDTITETLRQLHVARTALADVSASIKAHETAARESIAERYTLRETVASLVSVLEGEVKALAEAAYATTGETAPAAGVTVKLFQTMEYDVGAALAWAREKRMALVPEALDVRAFEKIAKATPLEFVVYGETPKPTIATDLSKHLTQEAA